MSKSIYRYVQSVIASVVANNRHKRSFARDQESLSRQIDSFCCAARSE